MFKAQVLGRLGRDAAVYESANGTQFLAFTLAVNTRNMGKDVTYWIDVRSFNPNHIKLKQYLQKGKILQIGGDINATIDTDKAGVVRINHTLFADYINFVNLGGSKEGNRATTTTATLADADETEVTMGNTPQHTVSQVASESETVVTPTPVPVMAGASGQGDDLPF